MRLNRFFTTAALLAACLLSNAAHADSFTYTVANHFTSFQVDGTITTDADSGTLSFGNIIDFRLLLTTLAGSEVISSANADNSGLYGYALTATPMGLFFDYTEPEAGLFFQNTLTGSFLCFQTFGCDAGFDSHESINFQGTSYQESQSAVVQIATVQTPTPEPSSLLMLGTGTLGAIGVMRRRLRSA